MYHYLLSLSPPYVFSISLSSSFIFFLSFFVFISFSFFLLSFFSFLCLLQFVFLFSFPLFLLFSSSSMGFIFSTVKASSWSSDYGVARHCKGVGDAVEWWLLGRFGGVGLGDVNFIVNILQNFLYFIFSIYSNTMWHKHHPLSGLVYVDLTALFFQVNIIPRQSNLTPNMS